jgi:hypothetical protein
LEKQKTSNKSKESEKQQLWEKQCTLDFFVKKSLETSSPQSDSVSSESEEG